MDMILSEDVYRRLMHDSHVCQLRFGPVPKAGIAPWLGNVLFFLPFTDSNRQCFIRSDLSDERNSNTSDERGKIGDVSVLVVDDVERLSIPLAPRHCPMQPAGLQGATNTPRRQEKSSSFTQLPLLKTMLPAQPPYSLLSNTRHLPHSSASPESSQLPKPETLSKSLGSDGSIIRLVCRPLESHQGAEQGQEDGNGRPKPPDPESKTDFGEIEGARP